MPVRVTVTNTGPRRGETLVEAHIHDRIASRTRPVRQLKAFARVALDPGASGTVDLTIAHEDLALVAADGRWRVEPGLFDLTIWVSSERRLAGTFEVTPV